MPVEIPAFFDAILVGFAFDFVGIQVNSGEQGRLSAVKTKAQGDVKNSVSIFTPPFRTKPSLFRKKEACENED